MTQPPHDGPPGWAPLDPSAPGSAHQPPHGAPAGGPPFPAPPPWLPAGGAIGQPRKTNGFAIAALILGLLGGVLLAVIFGITALVQIRRNGESGRGMAVAGLVAAAVWLVGIVTVAATIGLAVIKNETSASGGDRSPSGSALRPALRPGECFDLPPDDRSPNVTIIPCGRPHDAQTILTFKLPDGSWPGSQEVERQAFAGCRTQITTTFQIRTLPENTTPYVLVPRQLGWLAGDHSVTCNLTSDDGGKLTGPIVMRESTRPQWSELAAGDCFNEPQGRRVATVTRTPCTSAHTAQVTHTFTLPSGGWPGESTVADKADRGCTARQNSYFDKHPPRVPLEQWWVYPTRASWAVDDRLVVCYVTGKNHGPLKRSLMGR
jgi:hypothetical protein